VIEGCQRHRSTMREGPQLREDHRCPVMFTRLLLPTYLAAPRRGEIGLSTGRYQGQEPRSAP